MSSIGPATRPPGQTKLKGDLGVGSIVLMVVATAAPLTVMVANTPLMISMGNGAAAPVDAVIGTIIMLLFTVGFMAMSPHINNAGAFYAYVQKGLGRVAGLGTATLALFSYFCILVALEAYIGFAISQLLLGFFGFKIPWQIIAPAIVVGVGLFGYRDVELSSKFLSVALVLEIAVVLLIDGVIVASRLHGGLSLAPFTPAVFASGSPGLGILFAVFSFLGFEATAVFREEARNPEITIPRATYLSVFIIGVFYVISIWCEVVGVGVNQVTKFSTDHPGDMYQLLAHQYVGRIISDVVQVLLISSLFAAILSIHNVIVRYKYTLSRNGVFHKALCRIHDRHGSPYVSSFLQTMTSLAALAILALLHLDPVTQIYAWGATAGTMGYMVMICLTCTSVFIFFASTSWRQDPWRLKVAPALGLIGFILCIFVAVKNLPALIGGPNSGSAAKIMIISIMVSFFLGIIGAICIRLFDTPRYEQLES